MIRAVTCGLFSKLSFQTMDSVFYRSTSVSASSTSETSENKRIDWSYFGKTKTTDLILEGLDCQVDT